MLRLTLPAGEHRLALNYGAAGGPTRRIELGTTPIIAGKLAFATARVWEDGVIDARPSPVLVANPSATTSRPR